MKRKIDISNKAEGKLKIHFEMLSLIFLLTLFTVITLLFAKNANMVQENKGEEYIATFKESKFNEIFEILDTDATKTEEKYEENNKE